MSWTQAGWSWTQVTNSTYWTGTTNANKFSEKVNNPMGYKNGVYTVGVFKFPIPNSTGGVRITKVRSLWLRLQGTWSGSGSLKGFLCEAVPSNDTPVGWRTIGNNGQYLAEATHLIDKLDGATTVNITFNTAVEPGRTYYICLYSPNAVECQLSMTNTTWYPEIWLDYDTSALKLHYMQFNGLEPMVTQEVVPGSYKAIDPASYKIAGTTLKEHWKDQSAYFVNWTSNKSDKFQRRPDSERIAPGATVNVTKDTYLYPIGALVDHFVPTEDQILMAPYDYDRYTHAFQGPHGYSGMSIDVPKSMIEDGNLKRRLLYVQQGDAWHMLNGPYQSQRDSAKYFTYRLTGRGTDNIIFFNAAANTYSVQLIALDDRSIDLATNTGQRINWNSFGTGSNYRDRFSGYVAIPDSSIKNIVGMDNDQHVTVTMPVYKIRISTFAGGTTIKYAKSNYAGASSDWITSDSPWTYENYFSFVDNYKGLLPQSFSSFSLSSGSTQPLAFENQFADKLVFPTANNVAAPLVWTTSTWQSLGNQLTSKLQDNYYDIVYYKDNITIKAGKDYKAIVYWIGVKQYWFIADSDGVYKYSPLNFDTKADYGDAFLYYEYQGKHYTSLSSIAVNVPADLIGDEAPVIRARKGDSNGFAYIKANEDDTQLTQYYIYYKVDDGSTELKRVKPLQKTASYSRTLQPLVFNSLENEQAETS